MSRSVGARRSRWYEGLTYQRFLMPEVVGDEVIYAAFDALAGVRPAR
jgi:hypothetical protein